MKVFQTLLGGLKPEIFFEDFWTKKEYLNQDAFFNEKWFGLSDIEQIISMAKEKPANLDLRVIKDGKKLAATHYTVDFSGALSLNKLNTLYQKGSTLSLRSINEHHLRLHEFTTTLSEEFNEPTQINAYLTPKNSQGFDIHYDHHEIFILQLKGEKHWSLYDLHPYPLPATSYYDQGQPDERGERLYSLKAGDVLYIPRGMWHKAYTSGTSSLHLTLNIKCRLKIDFLHWVLNRLAGQESELRKNFLKSPLNPVNEQEDLMNHLKNFNFVQSTLADYQNQFSDQTTFYLPFDQ